MSLPLIEKEMHTTHGPSHRSAARGGRSCMRPRMRGTVAEMGIYLIILCVSACLAGCASKPTGPYAPAGEASRNPEKAEQLNQRAADLMDTDPEKAEKLLREALTCDLFNGAAHNNLGIILMERGLLFEAAGEFEWARKLLPGHPDPRMNLAYTLELAGRTDEAISTFRTALEVYPDHLPTMQALSRLQVRSGKQDAETPRMLKEVAMRGETPEWRDWARLQMVRDVK